MDVGIDADPQFMESNGHHEIRRFSADPRQREQIIERGRNLLLEPADQVLADLMDPLRLGSIKPNRVDQFSDRLQWDAQQLLGSSGPREKSAGGGAGDLIPRP